MQNIKVISQYIKTLSFEVPGAPAIFLEKKGKPDVEVAIDLDARKINDDNGYEVTLKFTSTAKIDKEKDLFDLEIIYGGIFTLEDVKEDVLEQILLIYCPSLLFPYLRRIISNLTSDAGLTPLMINPIDFAKLYNSKKKTLKATPESDSKN